LSSSSSSTPVRLRLWLSSTNSSSAEAVPPLTTQAQLCTTNSRPTVSLLELFFYFRKSLLNQQEDKSKKLSDTKGDYALKSSERNKNTSSNMQNQYAKVKNAVKGEKEFQDDTDHGYGFVDEFLKEALNTSNIYESQ
jgi:hypothetical protein